MNRGAAGAGTGWSLRRWLTVSLLPLPRGRNRWGGCIPGARVRDDAQDGRASPLPQEDSPNSEMLLGERAGAWPLEQDGDGLCLLSGQTPSGALRETVSSVELNSELGSVRPTAGGCPGRPRPTPSLFGDHPGPTLLSPARRGSPQPGSSSAASPVPWDPQQVAS